MRVADAPCPAESPIAVAAYLALRTLGPFAMNLWREELAARLPAGAREITRRVCFGGLYQLVAESS